MATNFPGPYQLRVYYDSNPFAEPTVRHVMQFNIDCDPAPTVGQDFSEIFATRRVGAVTALDVVTDALVAVLRPIMSDADETIAHVELWEFTPMTFQAAFISTYFVNLPGVQVNPATAAALEAFSFRTQEGGIMFVQHLEGPAPGVQQLGYADLGVGQQGFVDHMVGDTTSYWLARDTSYPVHFMRMSGSTHESVFNKRFR